MSRPRLSSNLKLSNLQATFTAGLEESFTQLVSGQELDVVVFRSTYSAIVDQVPLHIKELEYLVEKNKVSEEEMGEELEDPCKESCFVCDALFEKNQGVAVKIPFCDHRAHIECIRKDSTTVCKFCGNGIRSSLYSTVKSALLKEKALKDAIFLDKSDSSRNFELGPVNL